MNKRFVSLLLLFSFSAFLASAQRAQPIRVLDLFKKIPVLASSAASYAGATRETSSDGLISIKDAGPVFNSLQQELMNIMQANSGVSMGATGNPYSNAAPPSQEQVNQMMQKAMQMQSMSPEQIRQMSQGAGQHAAPPKPLNTAAMQEMGKATDAAGQLNILSGELANKAVSLSGEFQRKIDALPPLKVDCKEYKVSGADLALPECGCVKAADLAFYQKRITLEDQFLLQMQALIQSYLPKFSQQVQTIDMVESDLGYGDALSMPVLKNQLVSAQQQALNSLIPILGIIEQRLERSAGAYADLENVNHGHLSAPCQ